MTFVFIVRKAFLFYLVTDLDSRMDISWKQVSLNISRNSLTTRADSEKWTDLNKF